MNCGCVPRASTAKASFGEMRDISFLRRVVFVGMVTELLKPRFKLVLFDDQHCSEKGLNLLVEVPQLINGHLLKLLAVHDRLES